MSSYKDRARCELCPFVHYHKVEPLFDKATRPNTYEISCKKLEALIVKTDDTLKPFPVLEGCPFKNMTDEEFNNYVSEFFSSDDADFM